LPPGMIRTTSTDMVKRFGDESILYNWMRNRNTIEFLGIWEQIYNPHFKPLEFERFRRQAGLNSFSLSPKKWIEATGAIGLYAKAGRGGGTYAHKDIAFEFGSWLSPEFKLFLSWPRCKRAKPPSKPSNRKRPGSAPIAAPPTSSRTALPAACSAFCAVAAHAPSTR